MADDLTFALERLTGEIRYARRIAKIIIDGRKAEPMPRVGFRGIKKYGELTEAKLDQGADKLADRYDQIAAKGDNAFKAKNKELDGHEAHLNELEATMTALTNGGDPLDDAATQQSGLPKAGNIDAPVIAAGMNGAEKKTAAQQ